LSSPRERRFGGGTPPRQTRRSQGSARDVHQLLLGYFAIDDAKAWTVRERADPTIVNDAHYLVPLAQRLDPISSSEDLNHAWSPCH
jgi:hypothetical protein